jgi:hypothetical protein
MVVTLHRSTICKPFLSTLLNVKKEPQARSKTPRLPFENEIGVPTAIDFLKKYNPLKGSRIKK